MVLLLLFVGISLCIITNDRYFRDEHGRVRIFHGLSRVTKSYPWYDELLLDDTLIKKFQVNSLIFFFYLFMYFPVSYGWKSVLRGELGFRL